MEIEPSERRSSNRRQKLQIIFYRVPASPVSIRNRGFGSLLLKESLLVVARQGASQVFGITRSTSPAAKFVYPKFGGTSESYEMPMGDVALAH
jgi:hypothetical protein